MVANLPVYGKTAIILNYGYLGQDNEAGFIQQYVNIDGQIFMRERVSSGYGDWCSPLISSGDVLPAGFANADELPPNQIFAINTVINESTFPGLPLYGVSGMIYTLTNTFSDGVRAQTVIYSNGLTFTRWMSSSGYGSWTNSLESSGNLPGSYTSADELPYNQIFGISSSLTENQFSGLPMYGTSGIVYTLSNIGGTGGVKVQVVVYSTGVEYRRFATSAGWSMWSNDLMASGLNLPAGYANADALPPNQIFGITTLVSESTFPGLPLYGVSGMIYTLTNTFSDGVRAQTVIYRNGLTFTRWMSSAGYGSWTNGLESSGNLPGGYTNADELPYNQIFGISSSLTESQFSGLPVYGSSGIVYTLSNIGGSGGVKVQVAVYSTGAEYRRFATSAGYGSWMNFDNVPLNFVNTCVDKPITINSSTKIYLFGDSLTTTTHGGFTWVSLIAEKFGCTSVSYGVGSAVFDNTNENSIIAQINGVSDWSDVDIIIVAAGVNDCRLNSDVDNFKNSVLETITTLKQKAPNAKLVYITPLRYNASTLDNLNDYAGAICNLAVSNGCSVINGFDFPIQTYDTEWVTELTDNDGLHPNATGKHVYAQSVLNALL
jgi:lysophospholipase L1-like esterase